MLLQEEAQPLPGEPLYVNDQQVAITSPLGMVSVPRSRALRLVLSPADAAVPVREDVAALADGSIVYGEATMEDDRLTLRHAELGELVLPRRAVRWLRRGGEDRTYLTDLVPKAVDAQAIASDVAPDTLRVTRDAVALEPHTSVRYKIPGMSGKGRLLAAVAPLHGAEGKVVLRIVSGGGTVWERSVGGGGGCRGTRFRWTSYCPTPARSPSKSPGPRASDDSLRASSCDTRTS